MPMPGCSTGANSDRVSDTNVIIQYLHIVLMLNIMDLCRDHIISLTVPC